MISFKPTRVFSSAQFQIGATPQKPSLVISLCLAFHAHPSMAKIISISINEMYVKKNQITCTNKFLFMFLVEKPPGLEITIFIHYDNKYLALSLLICCYFWDF